MSWAEFRDVLHWLPNTGESALFRALNPDDWAWANVETRLLAEIATIGSRHQFLTARELFEYGLLGDEFPLDHLPATYGPRSDETEPEPEPESEPEADDDADRARSVAAAIRAA